VPDGRKAPRPTYLEALLAASEPQEQVGLGYDQSVQAESGDALVARGGVQRDPAVILEAVEDNLYSRNKAVLSVCCNDRAPGETAADWQARIVRTGRLKNGQIQWTTLGALRECGFSVVWEVDDGEAPNHHHVYFQEPVTESQVRAFVECFSEPQPNPVPKEERGQ